MAHIFGLITRLTNRVKKASEISKYKYDSLYEFHCLVEWQTNGWFWMHMPALMNEAWMFQLDLNKFSGKIWTMNSLHNLSTLATEDMTVLVSHLAIHWRDDSENDTYQQLPLLFYLCFCLDVWPCVNYCQGNLHKIGWGNDWWWRWE